jgi:hypothetical protein
MNWSEIRKGLALIVREGVSLHSKDWEAEIETLHSEGYFPIPADKLKQNGGQ